VTVARQVAWNTVAQTGARVLVLGFAVVTTGLLTRYLGVAAYGDYIVVSVYISLFALLFDWGIPMLLAREMPRVERPDVLFGEALALRMSLAVLVCGLAASVAFLFYGGAEDERVRNGIMITLPIILAVAISTTVGSIFQVRMRMDRVAAAEIASQALAGAVIVALVLTDQSFYWIVLATVVAAATNAALLYLLSRRLMRTRLHVNLGHWRQLIRTALPLGLAVVVATVYFRADALLLSLLQSSEDVGIYGVAFRFFEMTIPFAAFFLAPVFPLLSVAAVSTAGLTEFSQIVQRSLDVLVVAAALVVAVTLALAPEMVRFVAGDSFERSAVPLRILIVGAGLTFLSSLFMFALVALDRQRTVLLISLAALAANLALNAVLIPRYSYNAAAVIATGSQALTLSCAVFLVHRYTGLIPSPRVIWRALVAGGAVVAALLLIPTPLLVSLVIGTLLYGLVLLALRVDRELDLRELLRGTGT
jgi:O-antigen/teichoic acid export membrane protein